METLCLRKPLPGFPPFRCGLKISSSESSAKFSGKAIGMEVLSKVACQVCNITNEVSPSQLLSVSFNKLFRTVSL